MIKRKVYLHVSSGKVIITDAKQFAAYTNDDAIYMHGMLKIHHAERINESNVDFYLNSPYKCEAVKHRSITFQSNIFINGKRAIIFSVNKSSCNMTAK